MTSSKQMATLKCDSREQISISQFDIDAILGGEPKTGSLDSIATLPGDHLGKEDKFRKVFELAEKSQKYESRLQNSSILHRRMRSTGDFIVMKRAKKSYNKDQAKVIKIRKKASKTIIDIMSEKSKFSFSRLNSLNTSDAGKPILRNRRISKNWNKERSGELGRLVEVDETD